MTLRFASGLDPWADIVAISTIRRLLLAHDVVHAHRGKEHWLAALANRLLPQPIPLVRTRHIVQPVRAHAANRWLYQKATAHVLAVTESIRQGYLASGLVPEARIHAVHGGVDIEKFSPQAHPSEQSDRPLIGLVGGLRFMKGHGVTLRALVRLKRDGLKFRALFVGQGSQEASIRSEIKRSGLEEEVRLAGFVTDLADVMSTFDLAVYAPLQSDGMSRVVFEYLAMARPLVATGVGVVPEILHDGENALIVPPGDHLAMARALGRLLNDRALACRIGEAGRRLVESKYSGACLARTLEALYRSLLGSHQRSAISGQQQDNQN
jgi:glycosyltransferase involved in cell wall biosynthesis